MQRDSSTISPISVCDDVKPKLKIASVIASNQHKITSVTKTTVGTSVSTSTISNSSAKSITTKASVSAVTAIVTAATGNSEDDLGSCDEVKVFKDEGEHDDEKISSAETLLEEKSSLIDLTESEVIFIEYRNYWFTKFCIFNIYRRSLLRILTKGMK